MPHKCLLIRFSTYANTKRTAKHLWETHSLMRITPMLTANCSTVKQCKLEASPYPLSDNAVPTHTRLTSTKPGNHLKKIRIKSMKTIKRKKQCKKPAYSKNDQFWLFILHYFHCEVLFLIRLQIPKVSKRRSNKLYEGSEN